VLKLAEPGLASRRGRYLVSSGGRGLGGEETGRDNYTTYPSLSPLPSSFPSPSPCTLSPATGPQVVHRHPQAQQCECSLLLDCAQRRRPGVLRQEEGKRRGTYAARPPLCGPPRSLFKACSGCLRDESKEAPTPLGRLFVPPRPPISLRSLQRGSE
jgi:hypothetical protein